jgi:hypothetical protein
MRQLMGNRRRELTVCKMAIPKTPAPIWAPSAHCQGGRHIYLFISECVHLRASPARGLAAKKSFIEDTRLLAWLVCLLFTGVTVVKAHSMRRPRLAESLCISRVAAKG